MCWTFQKPVGLPGDDSNTCNGDSGGPLFVDLGGGQIVAGVTSGGNNGSCQVFDESYDANVFTYASFILGQLGDLTGYESEFSNKVAAAVDLLRHPTGVDLATLAIGLLTIALILLFDRTRLRSFSMVIAIIIGSAVAYLLDLQSVQVVGDIADIPRSLPIPTLPQLSLVPEMLGPAIAVAIIGLVQGAGVGRSYANPDGTYPDPSQDFSGQGIANIVTGFF